jgi:hypothetical protein
MTDETTARQNLRDALAIDRTPVFDERYSLELRALVYAVLALNATLEDLVQRVHEVQSVIARAK